MSAKFILSVLGLAICIGTSVLAQEPFTSHQPILVSSAAFSLRDQDTDKSELSLEEQLRLMELRLRELEQDVAGKIEAQPAAKKEQEESEEGVEKRLSKLEETVEEQGEAVEGLEGDASGLLFHSHKNPKMSFFGRIHADYWAFPNVAETLFPLEVGGMNPQDRFNFRRLRIGIKGDLNDNMFYKYEGEFAEGINPSYRDAFLGFKDLPWLRTVIIGNHKRPYGLDHLNSSRYNLFLERPFIVEAFNQDARRLGISSNGFSQDQKYNWRFGVWNQELTQTKSGYIGDHYQLEFAGRLAATPWYDESSGGRGYMHVAVSGAIGSPDGRPGSINNGADYRTRPEARSTSRWLDTGAIDGANSNYLVGFENVINIGSVQVTAEYLRTRVDRRDAFGRDVVFDGGYVEAAWMLTGEHMPWNRERGVLARVKPFENFFLVRDCDANVQKGWGAWQIAARYSHADLTDLNVIGGIGNSYTFGLNWYWNPYARMQFNYIGGNIDRVPEGFGDYGIIGMRLMVDF